MHKNRLLFGLLALIPLLTIAAGLLLPQPALAQNQLSNPQSTTDGELTLYLPLVATRSPATVFGAENGYYSDGVIQKANEWGVSWLRVNALKWSDVEPTKGQRQWSNVSSLEAELKLINANSKDAILIIRRTPSFARKFSDSSCGPILDAEIATFATFVYDAVLRYSAAPYSVRYYEIWNEPDATVMTLDDVYGCWGRNDSRSWYKGDAYYAGKYFSKVLKSVYPKVKSANPEAKVLIGGLLMDCDPVNPPIDPKTGSKKDCTSSKYLEGILADGGAPYFDIVSYHAYDYYQGGGHYDNYNWHSAWNSSGPNLINKTKYIKNLLSSKGVSGKGLFCTEIALLCDGTCGDDFEQTKANYVAQSYTASAVYGLQASTYYTLVNAWRNSGLVSSDLTQDYPSFTAAKFARQMLSTAHGGNDVSQGQVRIYEVFPPTGKLWVLWSLDGLEHSVTLSATPRAVYTLYGDPLPVSDSVSVGLAPVYIDWGP